MIDGWRMDGWMDRENDRNGWMDGWIDKMIDYGWMDG